MIRFLSIRRASTKTKKFRRKGISGGKNFEEKEEKLGKIFRACFREKRIFRSSELGKLISVDLKDLI